MTIDPGEERPSLSPDEAFSVLGNETRIEILKTLGMGDSPLSFSELRERVGVKDSGQFNYHLDQLVGHFVRRTDDGYQLRQAGRRVMEAVLSGAVTHSLSLEPTRIEAYCPFCGAEVEVSYKEERVLVRCTECIGSFADLESTSPAFGRLPAGTITLNSLPSAGFNGRGPRELIDTTYAWTQSERVLNANGICPRCSGVVDHEVEVCEDHQPDEDVCSRCHSRFSVRIRSTCSTCNHEKAGAAVISLLGDSRFRSYFERRGYELLSPNWPGESPLARYEEDIVSLDPFEARFTFRDGGEELVVTIDDELRVVGFERS